MRPRAMFVGPEQVSNVIRDHACPDWDWYRVDTLQDVIAGSRDGDDYSDINMIILVDRMFEKEFNPEREFETIVASFGTSKIVTILQYNSSLQYNIENSVAAYAKDKGIGEVSMNFVGADYESAIPRIIHNYVNDPYADDWNKAVISNRVTIDENGQVVSIAADETTGEEWDDGSNYFEEQVDDTQYLGQIIAVTSSKGGSGKSTVAVTLASYLAHSSMRSVETGAVDRPLKVAILDLDIEDGQIGFIAGSIQPTILNMRTRGISQAAFEDTVIKSKRLGVDLILAPKRPRSSADTPPQFYREVIDFLKQRYDYVILDTSVRYMDPLLEQVAYPMADAIVFVTDIVIQSVMSMTRWVQEVTWPVEKNGMGIPASKIGLVVNKAIADVHMNGTRIAKAAPGVAVVSVIPNNAKLMAHAANLQAMQVVLNHPEIRKSYKRIADAIMGKRYDKHLVDTTKGERYKLSDDFKVTT